MLPSRLIDIVLSPLGFGLLLACLLWLSRARLPRGVWRAGLVLEVLCVILSTPAGSNLLVGWQERRALALPACIDPAPTTIVLLAGGIRRSPRDAEDVGALNSASVQRTLDAAQLMRDRRGAELVISGGTRGGNGIAESTLMAALARRLGVPEASMRTEAAARTTWENAQYLHALVPALPTRVVLVTSAVHMPRALVAFQAAGFQPCTHASDFGAMPIRELADLLPRGGAVARSEAVLHELAGEIAYRWRAAHD